jgi:hypothetical protein
MSDIAGSSPIYALDGALRYNDFEGGFWSLELDETHDELGDNVVLPGWTPPAGLLDDSRVRARVRVREEQVGFLMAGTMADVLEVAPIS